MMVQPVQVSGDVIQNLLALVGYSVFFAAKGYLLKNIFDKKNCSGVSGKTQILYIIIFLSRSIHGITSGFGVIWEMHSAEVVLDLVLIFVALSILWLINIKFSDTYQREDDICRIELLILATFAFSLVNDYNFWSFSKLLESVAILPQLFLVARQQRIEPHVRSYVLLLALSQLILLACCSCGFYVHYSLFPERQIYLTAGIIQFMLYFEFFVRDVPIVGTSEPFWRLSHGQQASGNGVINTLGNSYSKEQEAANSARLQQQHQNFQDVPFRPPLYKDAGHMPLNLTIPEPIHTANTAAFYTEHREKGSQENARN